jgi:hypothetical protein
MQHIEGRGEKCFVGHYNSLDDVLDVVESFIFNRKIIIAEFGGKMDLQCGMVEDVDTNQAIQSLI